MHAPTRFAAALGCLLMLTSGWARAQGGAPPPPEPSEPMARFYEVVHADVRRCAAPQCSGVFVKEVNRWRTRCADGVFRHACHVLTLDTLPSSWSGAEGERLKASWRQGTAVVLGILQQRPGGRGGVSDVLTVQDAWVSQRGRKPWGVTFWVRNTGMVCIAAPCPSLEAKALNSPHDPFPVGDVGFGASGASEQDVATTLEVLSKRPVLLRGFAFPLLRSPTSSPWPPSSGLLTLETLEAYLPVSNTSPTDTHR